MCIRDRDPADPAKYLNSPETLVFRKGRTFYALDMARRSIAEEGFAVVVEGYMDVVALAQHGLDHCVATLGTALTEQHASILARYTPEICLVFDDDAAGMEAALRSIRVFENCAASVKVAPLKEGKDPDDYVREFGPEAFRELLGERIGLVEYRIRTIFTRHEGQGAEGRTKAAREVAGVLGEVTDIARRQALVAWAADEWAGPDVGRALRLEEALLQELHRRARETAPGERDAWEAVLVEQGFPRAQARQQGRRLARTEWLEQERRRQQFLVDVQVARAAGIGPDSEHSPVSSDFIGNTLAKSSHPVVRSAQRRERRMLTAMLLEPEAASQLLSHLSPDEMLLPIHREIGRAIAEVVAAGGTLGFSTVAERLSQDEELFAAAVDIAVAEDDYDVTEIERDVLLIREAQLLGDKGLRLYNVESAPLEAQEEGETLAGVEQQVLEAIDSQSLTPDDPAYQRLIEIRRRLHGRGTRDFWDL